MEIQVKVDELKKNKVFIATPMYGGMAHGLYIKSCLDLQSTLKDMVWNPNFHFCLMNL